jgi:phage shock protein PspC (stress-responsive transcriptional regulator)
VETTEIISEPRRLTRPKQDRWLGGVAAGLGEYFDLSPAIYRIAFVALALAGGTGVLLYIAAWLVIPEEGAQDSIAATELAKHRDRPRRILGFAIVAFVAILVLSESNVWPSPGNVWLVVVLGIAAFVWWRLGPSSSARRRIVAAFAIGLVALLLATVAFAVRVPLFAGVGARVDRPVDVVDVHSKYELGVGKLTLDFGDVSLPKGQTFVKATVGIGDLRVIVPANASVEVDGRVQAGQLRLLDERDSGTHVRAHVVDRTGSGRVLVLDARTGLGKVEVQRG